jgi:hypothetical protein
MTTIEELRQDALFSVGAVRRVKAAGTVKRGTEGEEKQNNSFESLLARTRAVSPEPPAEESPAAMLELLDHTSGY